MADVAARRGVPVFFSNEGQSSPRVHERKGEGLAKRWLIPVRRVYAYGLTPAELQRVRELTPEHEDTSMARWHEVFGA